MDREVEILADIAENSTNDMARIRATQALRSRGFQTLELTGAVQRMDRRIELPGPDDGTFVESRKAITLIEQAGLRTSRALLPPSGGADNGSAADADELRGREEPEPPDSAGASPTGNARVRSNSRGPGKTGQRHSTYQAEIAKGARRKEKLLNRLRKKREAEEAEEAARRAKCLEVRGDPFTEAETKVEETNREVNRDEASGHRPPEIGTGGGICYGSNV